MPNNVSALNQTSATTRREMDYAGWDPQFQVPVNEPLGYYEEAGVGYMKRVAVSADGRLLVSGSTGGGTLSLAGDAASNRVSAFQTDAGNLRVSSLGGSFSLSADASGNRVSALSDNASQLWVSSLALDAANMRVSALQSGTWSLSALLNEGTAFVGQVSASLKASTANIGYVSATLDNGSVSAKSGDAGTLRVSADILTDTTNNGLTTFYLSAVSTTVTSVKSSAGRLYGWAASNNLNADHTYILVWDNAASAVTPGTTAPKMSLPLPPSGGLNLNVDKGIPFTTAISIAAVSANNGGSNPDTAVPVTIWYK